MRTRKYYLILVSVCLVLVFALLVLLVSLKQSDHVKISFLDVGQGDAIFITLPDSTTILIDAGVDNSVLYELGKTMPWWKYKIDHVVITHADYDHFGGLLGVMQKYKINNVWYSGTNKKNYLFTLTLKSLEDKGAAISTLNSGDKIEWSSGITMHSIWPPNEFETKDENAKSVVLVFEWKDISILFTGDAGIEEEHEFGSLAGDVDILKVGHHGSRTSSDDEFLSLIKPEICIISAGKDNSFGHPHPEIVERLNARNCEIFVTSEVGAIHYITDGNTLIRR